MLDADQWKSAARPYPCLIHRLIVSKSLPHHSVSSVMLSPIFLLTWHWWHTTTTTGWQLFTSSAMQQPLSKTLARGDIHVLLEPLRKRSSTNTYILPVQHCIYIIEKVTTFCDIQRNCTTNMVIDNCVTNISNQHVQNRKNAHETE